MQPTNLIPMQPLSHRVYIHVTHSPHQYGEKNFTIRYLEEDMKTPLGRMYRCARIDQVREILKRADCSPDQLAKFEEGLRSRGVGACHLNLPEHQYAKLK